MAFSFRQVRYFVAVVETGSISRASQQLLISQSTITEALQELERDLGHKLLERHARGVVLTHKGHQFLRHAHKILADISDARRMLSEQEMPHTGRLALGVTSLVAGYVLSDLLARFRRAFPAIEVVAVEDNREYLEHLLVNGELDVAVVVAPEQTSQSALQLEILEESRPRVWLPGGHAFGQSDQVRLAEVASQPLIVLTVDELEETAGTYWRGYGLRPAVAFRTASVEALRSLVATGAGIAIAPDLIYRPWSLEGDRIEARPIVEALPAVKVGVAWRRGSTLPQVARDFLAITRWQRTGRGRRVEAS